MKLVLNEPMNIYIFLHSCGTTGLTGPAISNLPITCPNRNVSMNFNSRCLRTKKRRSSSLSHEVRRFAYAQCVTKPLMMMKKLTAALPCDSKGTQCRQCDSQTEKMQPDTLAACHKKKSKRSYFAEGNMSICQLTH